MKYLTLIAAVTLLHQHQRPIKTASQDGRTLRYVETTPADIAVANTLAHQVLGQCLDELPPGTRRLLHALHTFVAGEAARRDIEAGMVRFTRRDLREVLGFGDTQLKVHLARLVDLELVAPIRTDRGGIAYELGWQPAAITSDGRVLPGLLDPATLTDPAAIPATTTGERSGVDTSWSAGGRGPVGPRSGPGRPALREVNAQPSNPFPSREAGDGADSTDPVGEPDQVVVADVAVAAGGGR